jgi:hypothetical protein
MMNIGSGPKVSSYLRYYGLPMRSSVSRLETSAIERHLSNSTYQAFEERSVGSQKRPAINACSAIEEDIVLIN